MRRAVTWPLLLTLAGCTGAPVAPPVRVGTFVLAPATLLAVPAASPGPADGPTEDVPVASQDLPAPAATRAPSPSPAPSVRPSPSPVHAPADAGGGSGGPPVPPAPTMLAGQVVDSLENPVAGALVTFGDGTRVATDAQGQFQIGLGVRLTPVTVAHDGYATSVVAGLDALTPLHLRPNTGVGPPYNGRTGTLTGAVGWPLADLAPGSVYYQDTVQDSSLPGVLQPDGSYAVPVTIDEPGRPRACLLALAANQAGTLLVGLTPAFTPFVDTPPATLPLVPADRAIAYHAGAVPPGLTASRAALEDVLEEGLVAVISTAVGTNGVFQAPAATALPGALRVTMEARDDTRGASSIIHVTPSSGTATQDFLAPPQTTVDAVARTVTWQPVAGAHGYHLEFRALGAAGPVYELWTTDTSAAVPAEAWPPVGQGVVTLEAVDAPGLAARQIASVGPRALRVAPWQDLATGRVARVTSSL